MAHRRADCVVVGAVALVAVSGVSAHELNLYTYDSQLRAALPDAFAVTESPISSDRAMRGLEADCLAEVIYYEARGEAVDGQKAVAEVVLQRTQDGNYPETVCGVVHDGVQPGHKECQFSFACDGSLNKPKDTRTWRRVQALAERIMTGAVKLAGATGHAIAYHSLDVTPDWAETMMKTAEIGNHVFYRRDPNLRMRLAQVAATPIDTLTGLLVPPVELKLEIAAPLQEVQPEVQISGAVGDGT